MDWHNQLELYLMSGAACKTPRMGKAFIDAGDDGKVRLDYENNGEEHLTTEQLEDMIHAEVLDDQPVTVWFMPQTDNSCQISVPVTEWTQVKTVDGGKWGPNALKKSEVLDRVNNILKGCTGTYRSGP